MQKKSVYKFAAEAGVPVGLYLTVISSCFLLSLRVPQLQNMVLPLITIFPFIIAFLMKKMAKACPAYSRFSPLWLFGIYSVIFGTLICMLFSLIYVVFVEPAFIVSFAGRMITELETSPTPEKYAVTVDMIRHAIDSHQLPSGVQFVTTMGWLTCFSGSILSLILALIISRTSSKKRISMFR